MCNNNKYEKYAHIASTLQSIIVIFGLVVGGIWTFSTFVINAEAKKNIAYADKTVSESTLLKRKLENDIIVNTHIEVKQIEVPNERWISVELSLSNTGNKEIKVNLKENSKFYLCKVKKVSEGGTIEYGAIRHLSLDYRDKKIEWVMLRPGATTVKQKTIQKVEESGIYLVRFSTDVPDSSIGQNRGYGAEAFLYVK